MPRFAAAPVIASLLLCACGASATPSPSITSAPAAPTPAPEPPQKYSVTEPRLTAMQENNDEFPLEATFEVDRPGTELRVEGVSYPLLRREGRTYVFANVHVPKLGENNAELELPTGPGLPARIFVEFKIHREMRTIDEYRKYAKQLDFKVVNKNPDAHTGEYVKGRGRIYQITEDTLDDGTEFTSGGLGVTYYPYSGWDDNVRFLKRGKTDFVEGDVVSFYGFIAGKYSYETTAGWNLTVPMVKVDFMERG